MLHWPQQQMHALALRTTEASRRYAGFDLTILGSGLVPDRVVTADDLARDGLAFPDYYGDDMLLPEGKTPAYLGQAVAILLYQDFARFRFAKEKLQFNTVVMRYGEVTALWVADLDLRHKTIRVTKAWKRDGEQGRECEQEFAGHIQLACDVFRHDARDALPEIRAGHTGYTVQRSLYIKPAHVENAFGIDHRIAARSKYGLVAGALALI